MSAKRRLLSIGHSYVVGANRGLPHAIQRAAGDAWDVHVAAPSAFHGSRDLRSMVLQTGDEPCPVTALPARWTKSVHVFHYASGLRSLLSQSWDLVHAWEEPYILAGAQIAWNVPRGTRYVFRTAQSLNKRYPPPFNWFERYAVRKASGWICSGRTVEANLLQRPGYADRPRMRAPLGVDVDFFAPNRAAGDAILRQLGWDDRSIPVIGYLGRFVPEKGIDLLTKALEAMTVPWRALFVGAGPMEPEVQAWAQRFPDRVRVCTTVGHADVPPYLHAMDLLVAPSQTAPFWKEQFGRMLVEGFAAGLPIIGSDSGEIPYVLEGIGDVVGEQDQAGWTAAMTRLVQDPERRRDMSQRGLEVAHSQYAWTRVGQQYVDFFDRLCEAPA